MFGLCRICSLLPVSFQTTVLLLGVVSSLTHASAPCPIDPMLGSRQREVPGGCSSMRQLGAWGFGRNENGALRLLIMAFFPRPLVCFFESTCPKY